MLDALPNLDELGPFRYESERGRRWRMLQYLLFPEHVEEYTGRPIIQWETVAEIAGLDHLERPTVRPFLEDFREHVLPEIEYSGWEHDRRSQRPGRKARTVVNSGLGELEDQFREAIIDSYMSEAADRVLLSTGRRLTRKTRAAMRRQRLDRVRDMPPSFSQGIVDYHNALDPQTFTKQLSGLRRGEAMDLLRSDPLASSSGNAWAQLLGVFEQPMPVLKPVAGSDRAFSLDASLMTVRSDLRRVLTDGWFEYDLRNAQLAIVAERWPVPEVADFLRDGGHYWSHLAGAVGLTLDQAKPGLKKATYALVFGAGGPRIEELLREGGVPADQVAEFWKADLVKALWAARDERKAEVKRTGGLTTIFGERVPVDGEDDAAARHALAKEAQAVEVKLMEPIYLLARTTKEFTVVLYQFDGVTIRYRDPRRRLRWEREIKDIVKREAERLGVFTELVGGDAV